MENQNTKDKLFDQFIWTIKSFLTLNSEKLYSQEIILDDQTWRVYIYPRGNYLSIYLDAARDSANLPFGWNKFAKFKFTLINQVNPEMNETKATHLFNARESNWGFKSFIHLEELRDSSRGFIMNDTCIIHVEIWVNKSEHENQVDQSVIKIEDEHVECDPLSKKMFSTSSGELVNFKGIGKVEQDFVPLLEEVCSRHPSVIDSIKRRSQTFSEWALTALGRVLHFLKTKKVRDMNEEAYNQLQCLWEELETFKFDLTWLESHVKSALGMKTFVERIVQVKRLEEKMADLGRETKRMKIEWLQAEVELEITRRDLMKAKEGFEEYDLDAELGCGAP